METHTIEWAFEPIRRLISLKNKESIYMNKIIIANNFTTYDGLYIIRLKKINLYLYPMILVYS